MKYLLFTAALMTATPTLAGGPVLVEEESFTAPADRENSWIVPVVILLGLAAIAASGGGDDAPAGDPGPKPCVFNGGGC